MGKYRLLDLFCGAGGAAMGYHRAGFEVVGVDIKPQPHYPFPYCRMDALLAMDLLLGGQRIYDTDGNWWSLSLFSAFHASPPCYENTWSARRWIDGIVKYEQTDQLKSIRPRLSGKLFILENTPGAEMSNYIKLYGTMFGLKVIRERWFELGGFEILLLPSPVKPKYPIISGNYFTVAGHGGNSKDTSLKTWQEAMRIDWMTKYELTQAIPPAYTEYIGKYLMQYLQRGE